MFCGTFNSNFKQIIFIDSISTSESKLLTKFTMHLLNVPLTIVHFIIFKKFFTQETFFQFALPWQIIIGIIVKFVTYHIPVSPFFL